MNIQRQDLPILDDWAVHGRIRCGTLNNTNVLYLGAERGSL